MNAFCGQLNSQYVMFHVYFLQDEQLTVVVFRNSYSSCLGLSLFKVAVLLELIDDLLSIVGRGCGQTGGQKEEEQAINRQTALYSLKLLCHSFGSHHQKAFLPVLSRTIELVANPREERNVMSSALLCVAEVTSTLKALAITQVHRYSESNKRIDPANNPDWSFCIFPLNLNLHDTFLMLGHFSLLFFSIVLWYFREQLSQFSNSNWVKFCVDGTKESKVFMCCIQRTSQNKYNFVLLSIMHFYTLINTMSK